MSTRTKANLLEDKNKLPSTILLHPKHTYVSDHEFLYRTEVENLGERRIGKQRGITLYCIAMCLKLF